MCPIQIVLFVLHWNWTCHYSNYAEQLTVTQLMVLASLRLKDISKFYICQCDISECNGETTCCTIWKCVKEILQFIPTEDILDWPSTSINISEDMDNYIANEITSAIVYIGAAEMSSKISTKKYVRCPCVKRLTTTLRKRPNCDVVLVNQHVERLCEMHETLSGWNIQRQIQIMRKVCAIARSWTS